MWGWRLCMHDTITGLFEPLSLLLLPVSLLLLLLLGLGVVVTVLEEGVASSLISEPCPLMSESEPTASRPLLTKDGISSWHTSTINESSDITWSMSMVSILVSHSWLSASIAVIRFLYKKWQQQKVSHKTNQTSKPPKLRDCCYRMSFTRQRLIKSRASLEISQISVSNSYEQPVMFAKVSCLSSPRKGEAPKILKWNWQKISYRSNRLFPLSNIHRVGNAANRPEISAISNWFIVENLGCW